MKLTSQQIAELVTPNRRPLVEGVTGSVVARLSFEKAELLIIEGSNSKYIVAPTLISHPEVRAVPGQGASFLLANSSTDSDSSFQWVWLEHSTFTSERLLGVDQSNESVVLDERAIIKWQLFAEPSFGASKELCLANNKFAEIPDVIGQLWWVDAKGTRRLIATISRFIENSTDGWTWYPKLLSSNMPKIEQIEKVAHLSAQMHKTLRQLGSDTFSRESVSATRSSYSSQYERLVSREILPQEPSVQKRISMALEGLEFLVGQETQATHGDFHVGQLLQDSHGNLYVIDFDGDPMQSQDQQREMKPIIFDLASMVCSIIHAGMVAIKQGAAASKIKSHIRIHIETYLDMYESRSGGEPLDRELLWNLVWLLEIRELDYANTFLQRWKYAPIGAIEYLKEQNGR